MAVRQFGQPLAPTPEMIANYAKHLGFHFTAEDLETYTSAVSVNMEFYNLIEQLPLDESPRRYLERDPGRAPTAEEDPFNAFIRFCTVKGAPSGPLAGRTVAVKDCIAVAGVPMTDGGRRMPYLVPMNDATVVERLLDAGATIIGKTNMEDLGLGLGEGSHFGASLNPNNPKFSTGGSSSGSGAAVAAGMADMALGADEGGSVRIPAAWCGLVGMKATHGLVPSYGMSYMDHTIDHIGPMTKTVADNALMLEVIAGADERDPQWVRSIPDTSSYSSVATAGIEGMRIGVLTESLEASGTSAGVLAAFENATRTLEKLGAEVIPISLPEWTTAAPILMGSLGLAMYGMWFSYGQGMGHMGEVDMNTVATNAVHAKTAADDFPPMMKSSLLTAMYARDAYLGVHFAKAQNLRLALRKKISALFNEIDLFVTPTTPTVAFELLDRKGTLEERMSRLAMSGVLNTCPLDLSGHPALSVPCGVGEHDLPVGLQIVGPHFGEERVYQAGFAFEGAYA